MHALEAHGVYRLTIEEGVQLTAWILTVEADAATATTAPLELSATPTAQPCMLGPPSSYWSHLTQHGRRA